MSNNEYLKMYRTPVTNYSVITSLILKTITKMILFDNECINLQFYTSQCSKYCYEEMGYHQLTSL